MKAFIVPLVAAFLCAPSASERPESSADSGARFTRSVRLEQGEQASLETALAENGIRLDRERGVCAVPASVLIRDDLLEYLLVGPRGQTHESLLLTEVAPSLLNAALLVLGVEPGENATWEPPADETGEPVVHAPHGDGLHLYLAWREDEETYFFRVEDLISNLMTGRSMRRHAWVYLGSRFVSPGEGEPEVFAADLEQNHVNIAWFFQGNTLLTAALEECVEQTIWIANPWLLPPRDSQVELLFARGPLEACPAEWVPDLPRVARTLSESR